MSQTYDFIVVGSGHNPLITAAYLAKAGFKILVLERSEHLGGGVITQELGLPGFKHDLHSTVHAYIQGNPLLLKDELGLKANYGLEYIYPDVPVLTIFDDQTSIATYADIDRTCDSIAAISPRDAEAYRKFAAASQALLPMLVSGLFVPPAPMGPFLNLLDQSSEGRDLIGILQKSALDLVLEHFENEKVILHLLKFVSEGIVAPEEKGTGITLFTMPGFVHTYPPGLPKGGSGMLVESLIRCLKDSDAELRESAEVSKILTENGKTSGVRLSDGEEIHAKHGVIASIHPHLIADYVNGLDEKLVENARKVMPSSYSPITAHFSMSEAPKFNVGAIANDALITGLISPSLESFRRVFDSYRYGEIPKQNILTSLVHSNHDSERAPDDAATLYLWTFAPFTLRDGGAEKWDQVKEQVGKDLLHQFQPYCSNVNENTILESRFATPLDVLRHSPSFQYGDVHGAGAFFNQFGGHRPTPELSQYAVPGVEGLYLSGCCMHPGGGVMGGGRATAIKIFDDYDLDFDKSLN
jgi:phytoene dehydrogenase-like protein